MLAALWFAVLMVASTYALGSEDDNLDTWWSEGLGEPKIQYLGVGGWLMHWRGEGILLAPSFSNPAGLFKGWPPVWVEADKKRIDTFMKPRPADNVTMLLVGHGHYDHLMDVPWVMSQYAPNAVVYGSDTVVHILHSMRDRTRPETDHWTWVDPERVKSARGYMATVPNCEKTEKPAVPGYWITSKEGHIRAMPIQSMHASHFLGYIVGHGSYYDDLSEVPTSVLGWRQGQSMAWLIDLLDDNKEKPVYRIHYQDSAAPAPCGIMPTWPDKKAIDLEILSVGSWKKADQYPEQLLKATKPRLVLLGHWENFFGNDPNHPEPMIGQHVREMMDKVQTLVRDEVPPVMVYLPKPFAEIMLPPAQ